MISLNATTLLTIINFLILVYILKKLLWGPLTHFLDERGRKVEGAIREAEEKMREAEELRKQGEIALQEARAQARGIVDKAVAAAQEEARRIREEAKRQAEGFLRQAQRELEAQAEQVRRELRREAAELSVLLAGRILKKKLSPEDHEEILREYISGWN